MHIQYVVRLCTEYNTLITNVITIGEDVWSQSGDRGNAQNSSQNKDSLDHVNDEHTIHKLRKNYVEKC